MQSAIDEVAQHCSTQIEAYAQCVDQRPNDWQTACATLKSDLTACAAKHSGLVNSVKARCRSEIEQYERCLKANAGAPETCLPQLHRLWECSEPPPQHTCGPECKH